MIKNSFVVGAAIASALVSANAAFAGGLTQEVVEPVIIVPAAPAIAGRWEGAYVGLGLSYIVDAEDEVGVHTPTGTYLGSIGDMGLSGLSYSLSAGYRWNNGKLVFGPELRVRGGGKKEEVSYTAPTPPGTSIATSDASAQMNWEATLRGNFGVELNPQTLLYGFVGYTYAEFDYKVAGAMNLDTTENTDGFDIGFGVEYAFNDNWSIRGEYEYAGYDRVDLTAPGGRYTSPTMASQSLNIGVNYSF
ncbi:outer membrane immunogenic protein [Ketogulonicigenium robustum]|uniref:Outer membrane immunogenic protein n=1 Tax=Ketogulonicigenium robustum TaxID=92947 RepID=A0A1W6P210_9RHOB|nr:porin family protein [Ketogulonicigenium robustum]ARO15464.1 outer membrane immunogenic protein [Ketogulonicigenium robustum]